MHGGLAARGRVSPHPPGKPVKPFAFCPHRKIDRCAFTPLSLSCKSCRFVCRVLERSDLRPREVVVEARKAAQQQTQHVCRSLKHPSLHLPQNSRGATQQLKPSDAALCVTTDRKMPLTSRLCSVGAIRVQSTSKGVQLFVRDVGVGRKSNPFS